MAMIFISATTSALQSSDSKQLLKGDKLEKIWRYLEYKKVPMSLCQQIIEFYEYRMTSSVSLSQMDEFRELPTTMHTKLTMELNKNVLQGCSLWAALPAELVLPMMRELKPMVFPPKQCVLIEGQLSTGLHFIEQGQVRMLKQGAEVRTLGLSDFFGESSLVALIDPSQPPNSDTTCETVTYCDMLVLKNEPFLQVLKAHTQLLAQRGDLAGLQLGEAMLESARARDRVIDRRACVAGANACERWMRATQLSKRGDAKNAKEGSEPRTRRAPVAGMVA